MDMGDVRGLFVDKVRKAADEYVRIATEPGLCNPMYRPLTDARETLAATVKELLEVNGVVSEVERILRSRS